MVALPAGHFVMGSPVTETGRFDDEPQRQMSVGAFAIGKYPITRQQWRYFVDITHRQIPSGDCAYAPTPHPTWRDPGFPQTDRDPVVCVSWPDANDYAQWLSQQTGHHYRLLTEAEWEYAARAGTTTAYPWGEQPSHDYANYGAEQNDGPAMAVIGRDRWEYTSPVGSFPPNAFGLYDMNGNVSEWVETCADADEHLTVATAAGCAHRYARGGLYADGSAIIRSAARNFAPAPHDTMTIDNYRSSGFGFRLARDS